MGPSLKDIACQINQEMETIYLWAKAKQLSLNIDKNQFYAPKRFPGIVDNITIDEKKYRSWWIKILRSYYW